RINLVADVIKLALIYVLAFVPWISYNSLIIVLLANTIVVSLIIYFYLKNRYRFRYSPKVILKVAVLAISTFLFLQIIKTGSKSYLLNTALTALFFLVLGRFLKITSLNDE
ncbi:MAG: hypothetical protein WBH29_07005, partial [Bacilli bacterium]